MRAAEGCCHSAGRRAGFGWDLQSGLEDTRVQSRFEVRTRESEGCGDGASLRERLAPFFAKAKRCRCECLSGGATHLYILIHRQVTAVYTAGTLARGVLGFFGA